MTGFRVLQGTASLGALGIALIALPAETQEIRPLDLPVVTAPPDDDQPRLPTATPGQISDVEPNQQDQIEGLEAGESRPGLMEGSTLVFKPRSHYLNRDRDTRQDNIGWALGAALEYKSGWWNDVIQVAGTVYTSQILYGPEEFDGTLLFEPGPEPITVLGEAYLT